MRQFFGIFLAVSITLFAAKGFANEPFCIAIEELVQEAQDYIPVSDENAAQLLYEGIGGEPGDLTRSLADCGLICTVTNMESENPSYSCSFRSVLTTEQQREIFEHFWESISSPNGLLHNDPRCAIGTDTENSPNQRIIQIDTPIQWTFPIDRKGNLMRDMGGFFRIGNYVIGDENKAHTS